VRTTDLCDAFDAELSVLEPLFGSYGARAEFSGEVATVRVFEDNVLVRREVERPGNGRVLVVDGGGSLRCALLGDQLAALALANGWSGIIVNGCIRDAREIAKLDLGVRALNTHPRKSRKLGQGETGVMLNFAGVNIAPGNVVYADEDGIVVAQTALDL